MRHLALVPLLLVAAAGSVRAESATIADERACSYQPLRDLSLLASCSPERDVAHPLDLPVRVGLDRSDRFNRGVRDLATETWLEASVPLDDGVILACHASCTEHELNGITRSAADLSGWVGLELRF